MNQTNVRTQELVNLLLAKGESNLAVQVAFYNLKTHLLARRGQQLRHKIAKLELDVEKHMQKVNRLSAKVDMVISSHEK